MRKWDDCTVMFPGTYTLELGSTHLPGCPQCTTSDTVRCPELLMDLQDVLLQHWDLCNSTQHTANAGSWTGRMVLHRPVACPTRKTVALQSRLWTPVILDLLDM